MGKTTVRTTPYIFHRKSKKHTRGGRDNVGCLDFLFSSTDLTEASYKTKPHNSRSSLFVFLLIWEQVPPSLDPCKSKKRTKSERKEKASCQIKLAIEIIQSLFHFEMHDAKDLKQAGDRVLQGEFFLKLQPSPGTFTVDTSTFDKNYLLTRNYKSMFVVTRGRLVFMCDQFRVSLKLRQLMRNKCEGNYTQHQ